MHQKSLLRYKFFGCRSERCCAICSGPRKGRSTFRRGTPHVNRWREIQRLQSVVDAGTRLRKRRREHIEAEKSLERKGLHALKRCRLPERCPRSLLTFPGCMLGGLFGFDVMHAFFINYCSYFLQRTHDSLTPGMKEVLDQRLAELWGRFRDPDTGKTSRTPKGAITSQVGLTAENRVLVVFLTLHVLGSQACIFATDTHERIREHVLVAGSALVMILTAVRKKRPYTEREWDEIFGPVTMMFFRALDMIALWDNSRKVQERREYNRKHPNSPRRVDQFTGDPRDSSDSSDNSTDEEHRGLAGFYDRCRNILSHAARHLKAQVRIYLMELPHMFT